MCVKLVLRAFFVSTPSTSGGKALPLELSMARRSPHFLVETPLLTPKEAQKRRGDQDRRVNHIRLGEPKRVLHRRKCPPAFANSSPNTSVCID